MIRDSDSSSTDVVDSYEHKIECLGQTETHSGTLADNSAFYVNPVMEMEEENLWVKFLSIEFFIWFNFSKIEWKINRIRANTFWNFRSVTISETITTQGTGSGVEAQSGNIKPKRKKRARTAKTNR